MVWTLAHSCNSPSPPPGAIYNYLSKLKLEKKVIHGQFDADAEKVLVDFVANQQVTCCHLHHPVWILLFFCPFFYSYLTKVKTTTNGADEVEYRWGPRAQVEVKKEDLIEFIKEIYGDEADATFVRELKKQAGLAKPPGQATASQQPASQEASGSRR